MSHFQGQYINKSVTSVTISQNMCERYNYIVVLLRGFKVAMKAHVLAMVFLVGSSVSGFHVKIKPSLKTVHKYYNYYCLYIYARITWYVVYVGSVIIILITKVQFISEKMTSEKQWVGNIIHLFPKNELVYLDVFSEAVNIIV